MKKVPISLLCGASAIIVTILLYFVLLSNVVLQAIHLITLVGVIVAEAITTAFAYLSKGSPRKVAAAIVSAVTVPISITLSVVYILAFPKGYVTYILMYFVLVILVNVLAAIIYNFESKKVEESVAFENAKQNMLYMRKIVKSISVNPAAAEYKNELDKLEEKLHFSNDSIISAEDNVIGNLLLELRDNIENSEYDVAAAITDISKKIDERNIMCSRTV